MECWIHSVKNESRIPRTSWMTWHGARDDRSPHGLRVIVRHMGWEMIVRHFRNEKATGAEMGCPIDSGIVTGDVLDSYWPIFSLSLVTVPEVFAKVNSVQFPWRLLSGEYVIFIHFNFGMKMSQCYTKWHCWDCFGETNFDPVYSAASWKPKEVIATPKQSHQ